MKRLILLACALMLSGPSLGQVPYENDGVLDRTFGVDGRLAIPFDLGGDRADTGRQIINDGSGGYWLVGEVETAASTASVPKTALAFARIDANGVPLASFGTGGKKLAGVDGFFLSAFQDSAGRLLVALATPVGNTVMFGVARFTSAGVLDTSFAGDGQWESTAFVNAIARAPGLGTWVSLSSGELVRLSEAGGSTVVIDSMSFPASVFGAAYALHVDQLDRIWWLSFVGSREPVVIRLTAAGALDTTYAGDGVARLQDFDSCGVGSLSQETLAILPGGTAVVKAYLDHPVDPDAAAIATALPDGTAGPVRCGDDQSRLFNDQSLVARDAVSVLAAGIRCGAAGCGFGMQRYKIAPDGSVIDDATFDGSGTIALFPSEPGLTPYAYATHLILDSGKPVLFGVRRWSRRTVLFDTWNLDFAVARYGGTSALFSNGFEGN